MASKVSPVLERLGRSLRARQEALRRHQQLQDDRERQLSQLAGTMLAREAAWSGHDWNQADQLQENAAGMAAIVVLRLHVATDWQNRLLDLHFSLEQREAGEAARRHRAHLARDILDHWEQLVDEERQGLEGEAYRESLFILAHNLDGREALEWQRERLLNQLEASVQKRQATAVARERRLGQMTSQDEDSWLTELENSLFEQETVTMERQHTYILLHDISTIRDKIDELRQNAFPSSSKLD